MRRFNMQNGRGYEIDISGIEGTNCYLDEGVVSQIESIVSSVPLKAVHFLGSGNYHYLSYYFLKNIEQEFALLLFDNHPDMQEAAFGDIMSCGSWLRLALKDFPNLKKVYVCGASPEHLKEEAPYDERVTILDYKNFVNHYVNDNLNGVSKLRGKEDIYEKVALDTGIAIDTKVSVSYPLYISIDKDVLSEEYAATDWDQGDMTLNELTDILMSLSNHKILGVDICGDKKSAPSDRERILNQNTNKQLLSLI